MLAVWLLVMGSEYGPAFAAELQHDVGCVQLGSDSPTPDGGKAVCSHGCAAHLGAHLFTIVDSSGTAPSGAQKAEPLCAPDIQGACFIVGSPFQPPKALLA